MNPNRKKTREKIAESRIWVGLVAGQELKTILYLSEEHLGNLHPILKKKDNKDDLSQHFTKKKKKFSTSFLKILIFFYKLSVPFYLTWYFSFLLRPLSGQDSRLRK